MTTYYVAASGSNSDTGLVGHAWQTSSKVEAVANAGTFVAGDQILFNRGDTFVDLTLYAGLCNGSSGNPIVFGAYGTGALPIFNCAGGSWCVAINKCVYLTFQDLQFTGSADLGFRILPNSGTVAHINFTRCRAYSNANDGFHVEGSSPYFCDDVTFTNCTADLNGRKGYHCFGNTTAATGIHYYNCLAEYNGQSFSEHGFSSITSTNVNWHECESRYTNINPGTGLPNSAFTSNPNEGIGFAFDDDAQNGTMQHCYSHHNAGVGIQATHFGTNNSVWSCLSVNNGGDGIYVSGFSGPVATNTVIYNNTTANNGGSGIAAGGTIVTFNIKNNIISNNATWGISFDGASSITGVTVDTNIIYGNTTGATVNVSGAVNTITSNPTFTTPGSVYTLQVGSPAINAGLNLGSTYSYLLDPGATWPSNVILIDQTSTAWEIGAYTSTASTTAYPPTSTVSSGSWTPSTGATLYGTIDETVVDDADYDMSGLSPTADAMEVAFTVTDPGSDNLHSVTYRIKADGGCNATLTLRQGTTTIKQWTHIPAPSVWTTYDQPLTSTEAATITNYSQLRLLIQAN